LVLAFHKIDFSLSRDGDKPLGLRNRNKVINKRSLQFKFGALNKNLEHTYY